MVRASLVAVIFIVATSFLPRNAHPPKCVAQHTSPCPKARYISNIDHSSGAIR